MKVAVVGSRSLEINDLENYLPEGVTEIISGGAKGIDSCAGEYAIKHRIKLTELLPEYEKYGRAAPLMRNLRLIDCADEVLAVWDGKSRGTKHVIDCCKKMGKKVVVVER